MSLIPMARCEFCEGKGKRELPFELHVSYLVMKRSGTCTIGEFARKSGIELTNAHHRIRRLVKLGVVRKVSAKMPAKYRVI
jgi:hypothetical protein